MQKYLVSMSIPLTQYATVFVEAESEEHAKQIALDQDKDGLVSWDRETSEFGQVRIDRVEVNPD